MKGYVKEDEGNVCLVEEDLRESGCGGKVMRNGVGRWG